MTSTSETTPQQSQTTSKQLASADPSPPSTEAATTEQVSEKVFCPHCLRTASNGIKCKGICVADSDY